MDFLKKGVIIAAIMLSTILLCSNFINANDLGVAKVTTLNGTGSTDLFGYSVGSGDINNDGYMDLIVSAAYSVSSSGYIYVYFGSANYILDGTAQEANITFNRTVGDDGFGSSVASGDVNNDGYADIIVGAIQADPAGITNAGQAYVFFGDNYTTIINEDASSYANITLNGTGSSGVLGLSVAAGDVNNDGYADIIVGAHLNDVTTISDAGQAFVFFGDNYTSKVNQDTSYANLTLNGTAAGDLLGSYVGTGDVNNDGYKDVITGAWNGSGVDNSGQLYIFFGDNYTTIINEDASSYANITLNGTVAGDRFGSSIASGDVNNDSYADVIVGAIYADPPGGANAGQAFVFFGANYTSAVNQDASLYANITLNGTAAGDLLGTSVGSGDVNNDGYGDIMVGAYVASTPGAANAGQAYVFFGDDYTSKVNQDTSYANLTLNGTVASDRFGFSLAGGDLNNDSYSEIIVGATIADPPGVANAGQAYVYVYDNVAPVVNLEPADNTYDTDGLDIIFGFTAVETHPDMCALYFTNDSYNWAQNQSQHYVNNTQTNFTSINLTDGTYTWNVLCNDTAIVNSAFNSTNFTLYVDTLPPTQVTITEPADTIIGVRDSITYKCESTDATSGIKEWTWTLIRPDITTVTKTGGNQGTDTITFAGDDDNAAGTYTVKCEVKDYAGWTASATKTFDARYSTLAATGGGGGNGGGGGGEAEGIGSEGGTNITIPETTPTEQPPEQPPEGTQEETPEGGITEEKNWSWLWLLLIIAAIITAYFIWKKTKKPNSKR
ncbi:MAG: FG-GAP-like repeat-containing protein [archaeon]